LKLKSAPSDTTNICQLHNTFTSIHPSSSSSSSASSSSSSSSCVLSEDVDGFDVHRLYDYQFDVQCEQPNASLYVFEGALKLTHLPTLCAKVSQFHQHQ
jgi:hypothetical protein